MATARIATGRTAMTPNEASDSGPDSVRARLLAAATQLLASLPPTKVTGRQIAELAGVNHGQIHHYFGSKDALVAATIADGAARYHQERLLDGEVFPLPIDTERRSPAWRTLAHLAATGRWRQPPFEPSPIVAALATRRAADLERTPSDPVAMADVAAVMALQRGWWIFQDIIETALAPFDPDLGAVRSEIATRSSHLVDEDRPLASPSGLDSGPTIPPMSADLPAPKGPDEVRDRLVLAAAHLLADRSPADVTTKEIATLAQVNHGQVHHYFASKEHLIAHAVRLGSTTILHAIDAGALPSPVPIQAEVRLPLWRTLAHLASTEEWAHEAYDRSPVVVHMVETVAARTGLTTGDARVHGQVAAVHALELGWAIYRNIIEYGLQPLGGDLVAMRIRLAAISGRLVDPEAHHPIPTEGTTQ